MMIDDQPVAGKRIVTQSRDPGANHRDNKEDRAVEARAEDASEGWPERCSRRKGSDEHHYRQVTAQGDMSPIIRLVDTTIFTALQRRARTSMHRPARFSGDQVPH
jgi:hypothetical protein